MLNVSQKQILVVDDEAEIRELLATRFRIFGFEVLEAEGGIEALGLLRQNPGINTVICDLNMNKGDGVTFIQEARKINSATPKIFAISGRTGFSAEKLFAYGADGFLPKPFDARTLLNTVRTANLDVSQRFMHPPYVIPQVNITGLWPSLDEAEDLSEFALGRSGFYLCSPTQKVSEGALVTFEVKVSPLMLKGTGVVRWVRPNSNPSQMNIGVEFTHLEPASLKQFSSWLKTYEGAASIPSPQISVSMPSKAKLQSTG